MMKPTMLAGIAALAFMSSAAPAEVFFGDTTGGPTWNRPLSGNPPTDLSAVGTDTPYEVIEFTVTADGLYDFLNVADGWDNFLFLYETAFDPLDQFTNVIIGNDDFPSIGISGFDDVSLVTGITYLAVTTGFDNDDFGAYTLTITGPGEVLPPDTGPSVPEPTTWAMLVAGLGAVGYAMRRQRRATVSFA